MNHDDVELSADEEATFLALAQSFRDLGTPPHDSEVPPASTIRPIVVSLGLLLLVVGGLIAATTAGHISLVGSVAWALGTVTTLWAVVTGQPALGWGQCPTAISGTV